jgi:hypothetical protein
MHNNLYEPDHGERSESEPQKSSAFEAGCMFVGGIIGGFIAFLVFGWIALSIDMGTLKKPVVIVFYLLASLFGAIWLATKPRSRGFAIGIFLGLGAVLLLMSICGHSF